MTVTIQLYPAKLSLSLSDEGAGQGGVKILATDGGVKINEVQYPYKNDDIECKLKDWWC